MSNECLMHIDFSENYVCKMQNEVLSAHFGASKKQISLHTGVYYVGHDGEANTFCTISESLQHGPAAIWAHLDTVLNLIQNKHPEIDTIHYFSDIPNINKKQMSSCSHTESQRGMTFGTWNFFESGHRKGVPDGVGATIRWMSDRIVHQGSDCKDATDVYTNWEVPTAKFNSTLYQQRSLKFQLKPCCQWLTWRLSQLVIKLWYSSRRYFISRDTYRSKLPIRSNNNGRGWKCTLDCANLYQARPIWFITWKESLA